MDTVTIISAPDGYTTGAHVTVRNDCGAIAEAVIEAYQGRDQLDAVRADGMELDGWVRVISAWSE